MAGEQKQMIENELSKKETGDSSFVHERVKEEKVETKTTGPLRVKVRRKLIILGWSSCIRPLS